MKQNKETKNIALIDLNHMTLGVHTNTVPLGIGLIASYIKKNISEELNIRIFKDPARFKNVLSNWKPDILGITQYVWNSELNLYMAQLIKRIYPDCLVVAGGPNLSLSKEEKHLYLKKHDYVDICASYDGEIPFTEIVSRTIRGEEHEDIKRRPPTGTYSIDKQRHRLVEPKGMAPKLDTLDVFGPVYANGFFDQLLSEGFHPFLQTQRGCPFRCAYCHTGNDYYSKVIFQSAHYFKQDMEYLGKRFAGKHNIILYLANTNFSLFREDFEIARIIREIQEKYDWPKNINVNSGNNPDRLLEVLSILKYKFVPSISLQTLTPKVLHRIKRKNIPFDDFVAFQKKVTKEIGENTATELILSLPEETKESFLTTLSLVLNSGVQDIVIYTLMSLTGTEIASPETIRSYYHILRHRIVPRCFSDIDGVKIFETEQVVVGTKTMPFEDYMKLRGLSLIVMIFANSIEIYPLRKLLAENNIKISDWIFGIKDNISKFRNLYSEYKAFLQETKDELFASKNSLIEFFSRQKNYDLLCKGKFGDNLLRKYKAIILSKYYKECLRIAFSQARRYLKEMQAETVLSDLEIYLRSRDVGYIFKDGYSETIQKTIRLNYDIPRWLTSSDKNAVPSDYKGVFSYSVTITDDMRRRLKDFMLTNRDPDLSCQMFYRDGHIKDFWPLWVNNNLKRSID